MCLLIEDKQEKLLPEIKDLFGVVVRKYAKCGCSFFITGNHHSLAARFS